MAINCIIIDDENEAREGLSLLLEEDSDIHIQQICSNGLDAIDAINTLKPDLILLDIQMPGANGFEVLSNINEPIPEVIFITAYDQFALKAFEVHALDYLLKPFSDERFYEALEHAKKKVGDQADNRPKAVTQMAEDAVKKQNIKETITATADGRVVVKSDGKIHFIQKSSITWVEAYDYYVKIHSNEKYLLVRETMKNILLKLGKEFHRIHKSAIVNTSYIKSIDKQSNNEAEIVLSTGQILKVSRSYKTSLMQILTKK